MTSSRILMIRHLAKRFGERVLFNIEEFSVIEGHCTLISGDNGSGKTTFLKIISGLLEPDQGKVIVSNRERSWDRAKTIVRRRIVYLHQEPYMFDTTVERNVAYGLRFTKTSRTAIYDHVAEALRWARLDHLAHRNAKFLSSGEKQRVALTRARILKPAALALDEPTANMDQQSRISTYQLIDELRSDGMAIIVASHDQAGLAPIADTHLQLIGGKLIVVEPAVRRTTKPIVTRLRG